MKKQTLTIAIALILAGGVGYWYYTNKMKTPKKD